MDDERNYTTTNDLHDVLADVALDLKREEVDSLRFRFKISSDTSLKESSKSDACSFFKALENEKIIREGDVRRLIDALRKDKLVILAKKLERYQNSCSEVYSDDDSFVGRESDIREMELHAFDDREKFRCFFISGIPGVGKTTLVKEFCRRQIRDRLFKVHFISCRGFSSAAFAQETVLNLFNIKSEDEDCYKRLRQKLCSTTSWSNVFIVLDNVEDMMETDGTNFDSFLCNLTAVFKEIRNASNCLLLTSRKVLSDKVASNIGNDVLLRKNLDEMDESDSTKLITLYLRKRELQSEEKKSLATLCGNHPLSMTLIASHLSCNPKILFSTIAESMKKDVVSSLKHVIPSDNSACITNSFFLVFHKLNYKAKDLLVRLSHAAVDVKHATAKNLFRSPTNGLCETVHELIERSLVNVNERDSRQERSCSRYQRYSMHMLIKKTIYAYCETTECSPSLKRAFEESRECLLEDYRKQMMKLSEKEVSGRFQQSVLSRKILIERGNFLPKLPEIVDHLISHSPDLHVFEGLSSFRHHLISNRQAVANFYLERKKVAKKRGAPLWVIAYFSLNFADSIRVAGYAEQAEMNFTEVKKFLQAGHDLNQRELRWLTAEYNRYYGRYIKDLDLQNLDEAISYFRKAKKEFRAPDSHSVFSDPRRCLAELYHDLGNAFKLLADKNSKRGTEYLEKAKSSFEKVRKIYEEMMNPLAVPLFEVNLSLAAVEMELKSGELSTTGIEDEMTMRTTLDYYEKAEHIAEENGELVSSDDLLMGNLYFSRAICHARARKFTEALADIKKAVKLRESVFGCHTRTMSALNILGYIAFSDSKIKDHNRTAFKVLDKGFMMAKQLARKGDIINMLDLKNMEDNMWLVCSRLEKNFDKYQRISEAIQKKDMDALKADSSDSFCGDTEISLDFVEYPSDSEEEEEHKGIAPSISEAKDLGDRIKAIMDEKAEKLDCLSEYMSRSFMALQVIWLRDGYPNMGDEKRMQEYQKGEELLSKLKTLDDYAENNSTTYQVPVLLSLIVLLFAVLFYICFKKF